MPSGPRRRAADHAASARRRLGAVAVAAALACGLAACSSSANTATPATTEPPSTTAPPSTTTTAPGTDATVFVSVGGNIDAYDSQSPYHRQRVVAAGTASDGSEPHGQICFLPDGTKRFVVAETRPAAAGVAVSAGFGLYQLSGDGIGTYRVARLSGFTSPGAAATSATLTYGCTFDKAGHLFTTDVGTVSATNSQAGAANGQLIEWFPPFTGAVVSHCVLVTGLAVPQGLASQPDGSIDLASAGAPTAGVWRYSGRFPATAADCATPVAGITATKLIPAGTNGLSAPAAVALTPDNKSLVVTSAVDGVIDQFDLDGTFATTLLTPSPAGALGATPFATGTPLGVAVNADGAVFYADPGLVRTGASVEPAARLGSLRRLAVQNGQAQAPTALNQGLPAPDGLGIFDPSKASGGAGSIA
jgi:hypothetical protein